MKKIFIFICSFMMIVGCQSKSKDEGLTNNIEKENQYSKVTYSLTESTEDIDMYTKENIKEIINDSIEILYSNNNVYEILSVTSSDYSEASDKYFDEAYQQNKDNFIDVYNKYDGLNLSIKKDNKTFITEGKYTLKSITSSEVKNYLELVFYLNQSDYNEDGTYPLDKLVQSLEDNGYTKQ